MDYENEKITHLIVPVFVTLIIYAITYAARIIIIRIDLHVVGMGR